MEEKNCPYLGLQEDPDSFLSFPSEGNLCLRTSTAQPIILNHQTDFCLRDNYSSCPIYTHSSNNVGETFDDKKPFALYNISRLKVPVMIAALLILVVPAIFFTRSIILGIIPSKSEEGSKINNGVDIKKLEPIGIEDTPIATQYEMYLASENCPPPEHWVYYFVQPGDDITELALKNDLSTDQLLKINCLKGDYDFLPGLMIYLPLSPAGEDETPTQTMTATSTVTLTETPTSTASPTVTITSTNTRPAPTSTVKPVNQPKPTNPPKPTSPGRPTIPPPSGRPTPTPGRP